MSLAAIQRVLGMLLMIFSFTMLPPVVASIIADDGATRPFIYAFLMLLIAGFVSWLPVRSVRREMRLRDGFIIVVMFWTVLTLSGSVPFIFSDNPHLTVTDAVFESVSGLTTTGSTVITHLDDLPVSILYYRQQLQWLGGMGIIVLAVAVLPMLGIGGMQLYRAETPGPMKDSKLTPRITETAKALWYIYLSLTVTCGIAYWLAGMTPFDALAHAFSTVSIGGFSTHDASMAYFDSPTIHMIASLFMFLSAINFALHFVAFRYKSAVNYWRDSEFQFYVVLMSSVILLTVGGLYYTGTYDNINDAMTYGIFQAVSISTTAGFTTAEFYNWPGFLAILLLLASFIGGCAGSTGGGIKAIRMLLLIKQGMREITRLVHPSAQIPVRLGDKVISGRVIEAVWGFFALYVASFLVMYLLLAASGLDLITAFSAVASSMNNLGPGLGAVGANYADVNDFAKWVLCFAMLLGRLEIFTLLVLLTPTFWRK